MFILSLSPHARVFDVEDGVELCTLARDLTGAPNRVKQFTSVVATRTMTKRPAVESQTMTSLHTKRVWIDQSVDGISTTLTKCQNVRQKYIVKRSDASL